MMKILQLARKFPYPLKDGEAIGVTNLAKSLAGFGCQITLLSMNTSKHYVDTSSIPASAFGHYQDIHTVFLDNRVTAIGALKNIFAGTSYHVSRYYIEAFDEKLKMLLRKNDFDIVQLESVYMCPYIDTIRKNSNAKISMRSHNVEYEIWERIVSNNPLAPKNIYLHLQVERLKKYELETLNDVDFLVTVTQRDLDTYRKSGYTGPGLSSPTSMDSTVFNHEILPLDDLSFCFIGSLDWMPNLEGLEWFLKDVWADLVKKYPMAKIHIAGRNTPDKIRALANKNIIIEGEVDDAIAFVSRHKVLVVPILSGSGIRVKILEGMALERVVVTTHIGAEGIDAVNQRDLIFADTAKEFFEALDAILNDKYDLDEIGSNARVFIKKHFDREKNARNLYDAYQEMMRVSAC